MAHRKILKIGLTGGIGSGKSTVAKYFMHIGVPVIDADRIAHELLAPNTKEFDAVVAHFGAQVLSKRGGLKRKYLRRIIFNDPQKKKWLEKLLHPKIYAIMRKRIRQVEFPYCILVIPLLFECKSPRGFFDRILVIDASEKTQIRRVMQRDKTSAQFVRNIIANQADRKSRLARADDIIVNEGSVKTMQRKVEKLHLQYLCLRNNNMRP